ncbi:MAG: hypothetical protein H0U18_16040 [Pyrinomonadaceae bacterium]|nr:hypothetical protein [Pyrinomonadaceae bacterium]
MKPDILKYGYAFNGEMMPLHIELMTFKLGSVEGKFYHMKKVLAITMPDLQWNDWLERQISTFCDDSYAYKSGDTIFRNISLVGCASAGKTFSAGIYAYHWWLADPSKSIAILTSTTKEMIGRRVWPVIQGCHHNFKRNASKHFKVQEDKMPCGNLVDSKKILSATKGDEKHAISAIAVRDGETSKAEANIRGQHAERILVMIDEANKTPEAILGTIPNLRKGCKDFTLIVIGNPESRLDPHGKCCEPVQGFSSRKPGSISWRTKGVPEWQIEPGICLQFRGDESPNVKAGKTEHPKIYSFEDYKATLRDGVRNTLRYWVMDAGEWPPDGFCNTIFNETMVETCKLRERRTFRSSATAISSLDPAFGGDGCVQKIAMLGDLDDGRQAMHVTASYEIPLDPSSPDDYEHQIARSVVANCARHGVSPENFVMDATAIGRGVASVLFTDWSNRILKTEFGGSASELPASNDDRRQARDVYDRKVTELWFSTREFALAGQLGGLDTQTIMEFCGREYEMVGKKYKLEAKEECKVRLHRSPDNADAVTLLVELARVRHGAVGGGLVQAGGKDEFEKQVELASAVYDNVSYDEGNFETVSDEY